MKKIVYIIILVFAGMSFSCEKYLEAPSKSTLDESSIFSNPVLASRAVDGILEQMGQTNSYRGRFLTHYGANTDIEWVNTTSSNARSDLSRYINSSTNTDMNRNNVYWATNYAGIERANLCIRGLKEYGDPQPGNEYGFLLGKALTCRAIYYADLLKAHGDIVARFEPVSSETTYLPKSDRGVIYKQIIADLEEAATLVPWPNESSTTATSEDINKAFIKGLRARLCMAAAGYAQYPDGIRRNSDPDLSVANLYPIALQECKDIIESGSVHLEGDFETVFRKAAEDIVAAGGESMWEIPWADGRGRHYFTYAIPHTTADQYTDQPRGGTFGPLPNVFYDFDVKDIRRDITCVPYFWGSADNSGNAVQVLNEGSGSSPSVNTWYFGKFRYEWMTRHVTSTNDDGVNKIYMRFAEVLLMAAEIENELNGPAAAAIYLKQIRQRAFDPSDWGAKVDAYVSAASASKETMFDAIVKEHGMEFCGEMERKQALIRWNLLKTKLDEAKVKMNNLRNQTGEYADVPGTIYYRYASDGETLEIYGLNRGETDDKSAEYVSAATYVAPSKLDDAKINSLYTYNPDQNQFWPIWQYFIDGSNGTLVNDYGY